MLVFRSVSHGLGTFFLLLGLSIAGAARAQSSDDFARGDTVTWAAQPVAARPGARATLTLTVTVLPGWHVYSLKQAPDGPTPLLVTLDRNAVATADGAVTESKPLKIHDPAFGLQTQYYEHAATLTVPVRLNRPLAAGAQAIPVSLRFQTCNGRICQPPKTVHLSAPVDLKAGG